MDLGDSARLAHERGWILLRIEPGGKRPFEANWPNSDAPQWADIRRWVQGGWNLGLLCGRRSGVVVVDEDRPGDYARLLGREPEPTVTVKTGGGGRHYYYRAPSDDVPSANLRGKTGLAVEIKSDGTQVVYAGSKHESGATYEWAEGLSPDDVPLIDLPYADIMEAAGRHTATTPAPAPKATNGLGYARAALDSELQAVATAPEGERNDTLNLAAFNLGQLVGGGALDATHVLQELLAAAAAAGLGEGEARKTIRSGMQAGAERPREAPERPAARRQTAVGESTPAPETAPEWVDDDVPLEDDTPGPVELPAGVDIWQPDVEPEPFIWGIDNLVRSAGLTVMHATGGVGKSHLLASMFSSWMFGNEHFCGEQCSSNRPTRLLWMAAEDSPGTVKETMGKAVRGLGPEADGFEPCVRTIYRGDHMALNFRHSLDLIDRTEADAVVVDYWNGWASFEKGQSAGSSFDLFSILLPFRDALHRRGVPGVLLHHHNRAGQWSGNEQLRNSADVFIGLEVLNRDLKAGTKTIDIHLDKSKGPHDWEHKIIVQEFRDGAVTYRAAGNEEEKAARLSELDREILTNMGRKPVNETQYQSDIAREVGRDSSNVGKRLRALCRAGFLEDTGTKQNNSVGYRHLGVYVFPPRNGGEE